ncbi:centrosomal protein of 131 kDa isoform X2 [Protopterus annectens]|uniref:centrosomal protein of 131 kDa isoform X2 n=1 Tax=Protopterus annectens TaxID=7888 RepID=UPI001CFBA7B0|nr:centrosomal protein of 131 kDa isoform X2 [Protopterus annectens]
MNKHRPDETSKEFYVQVCGRVIPAMHSSRSSSLFQASGGGGDGVDLSLTGSQLSVSQRPCSASPAKHMARSISMSTDIKSKRNTLGEAGPVDSRAVNNLRRSNSTTQVNQTVKANFSEKSSEDFLSFFESGSDGRRKLASLSKASPEKQTTWNILDDHPKPFHLPGSVHSTSSVDSLTGTKKREAGVSLAANFTANNRSNKGAVGNAVTTILHNNYSTTEKTRTPKSSNQRSPSFNNIIKATVNEEGENSSLKKLQKNFSSNNNMTRNNAFLRKKEVSEEEAERFIQQVNKAVVIIQRWYRRHSQRRKASEAALKRMLTTKKQGLEHQLVSGSVMDLQQRRDEERKKIREEKARQARRAAIQELQQRRAEKEAENKRVAEEEVARLKDAGKVGKKRTSRPSSVKNASPVTSKVKANNTDTNLNMATETEEASSLRPGTPQGQSKKPDEELEFGSIRGTENEDPETLVSSGRALSKTTLNDLLDTLKLLEEEPESLPEPKVYKKDKYAWIDEDNAPPSLTADNLERLGKQNHSTVSPEGGALLSEAKLQSIMSFLDEMEKSEQERPKSSSSLTHREGLLSEEELAHLEQASAVATEVTTSMMKLKLELEEKKRTINMLNTALTQQRDLTIRHVKETEKDLNQHFRLQKEQYEATIQRHLTFIDQLIDDKKVLSEKCESLVNELKQVDQNYTKKITQMQEQHDMEIKKLKELMSATEKIRREKWIDEKTKKIKEITVKGLEPEIQKLIAKHKQEVKKLKALHEAELLQSDERAAQRYVRQLEEMRQQMEQEKEELSQRERELSRQRYEKQLEEEEQALQQQRRRLYSEVAEEKERVCQQAARQRAELDDLRRQLEDNSSLVTKALKEEYEKAKEEQERRHQAEIWALKERLEIEKQAWEENYMKKQEAWLLARERELKEDVRRGRDKEIEVVIQRLEEETSTAKEESERAAENRIKRIRDKYEAELRELERSERGLQERYNELKSRLTEAEGDNIRLQGLIRQKELEVKDIREIKDRLTEERNSLSEVIRQEFADRLVITEEENKRLKLEASEMRARHRLELERLTREKEEELEEVHKRVKVAIVKKEEAVNSLRKQHEAALKRADHLETLLEQQRKQILGK